MWVMTSKFPHRQVQQQCFFLMGTVCQDSQDSNCSFFFFLKLSDSATSDVPSSLTTSRRTNRDVSSEVDDRPSTLNFSIESSVTLAL